MNAGSQMTVEFHRVHNTNAGRPPLHMGWEERAMRKGCASMHNESKQTSPQKQMFHFHMQSNRMRQLSESILIHLEFALIGEVLSLLRACLTDTALSPPPPPPPALNAAQDKIRSAITTFTPVTR